MTVLRRFLVGLMVAAACAVAASPAAAAVTRFASPTGSATPSECTDPAAPCTLAVALAHPGAGDTISLAAGTYGMQGIALPAVPLRWAPTDPASRPTLTSAATASTMSLGTAQSGTVIEGVDLSNTHVGTDIPALSVGSGTAATVRNVTVEGGACIDAPDPGPLTMEGSVLTSRATSSCLTLGARSTVRTSAVGRMNGLVRGTPPPTVVTAGVVEDTTVNGGLQLQSAGAVARRVRALGITAVSGEGLLVDSLARSIAGDGVAVAADAPLGGTLRAVNDTAIATSGVALEARPVRSSTPTLGPNRLVVVNTVARGGTTDLRGTLGVTCLIGQFCNFGLVTVEHSDFVTRDPAAGSLLAGAITEGPGNITTDPQFTNTAAADFHPLPGSPLIDAGTPAAEALPSDLDGRARAQGPAPDIGAFEHDVPAPVIPVTTGGGAAADGTAPVLGAPALSRRHLVVLSGVGAARRRALVTTVLTTHLNEAARIAVTLQHATPGARVGRACVKRTRARRGARRCTRWVTVTPTLATTRAAAGTVRLRLLVHPRRGALLPGRYRLRVVATDAAGNRSAPRFITVTVAAG
ncbi:MAG: choice-of-anchor Q domain-containing protein [Thermoleophilia bacterium]